MNEDKRITTTDKLPDDMKQDGQAVMGSGTNMMPEERPQSDALIREILSAVTDRYVRNDYKIPPEILAMKDEVMEIFSRLHGMTEEDATEADIRRLEEIRAYVCEVEYAAPEGRSKLLQMREREEEK